ncbi:MAG: hypothetical protein Rubg2KO_30100 [Rubricoccaceae bacterium]
MPRSLPRALAPTLAIGGLALLFGSFLWAFSYIMRSSPPLVEVLTVVGMILGVALQVAAIGVSVYGAWKRGGVPVVASLYGLAVLAAIAAWVYTLYENRQWYRDNPEAFSVEWNDEGTEVGVRTSEGVWWVPVDQCPNVEDETMYEMGTRSVDGYVEVSVSSDVPHMRLHVADQHVECLLTDLPLSDADLASALEAALNVEALRLHLPEDSTLLVAGLRLPPLDSVRVDGRPVRLAEGSEATFIDIRLIDPQPDRVRVDLGIYQTNASAQITTSRAGDGSWIASVQSLDTY